MKHLHKLGALIFVCILIIGCGGGGSSTPNPTPTPTPVATPTPVPSPSPTPTPVPAAKFAGCFRSPGTTCTAFATAKTFGAFVNTATISMSSPRANHQAVALPDGTVLLVGGSSDAPGAVTLASADLFDPSTETIAVTTAMNQPRSDFGATLLSNGKVLLIGGDTPGFNFDIYDPATKAVTSGNLSKSILMAGIKVFSVVDPTRVNLDPSPVLALMIGGHDNLGTTNSPAQLDFTDPTNPAVVIPIGAQALPGLVIETNDLNFDQSSVIKLSNGHLLISGGRLSDAASSTSIFDYDPTKNTLTKIGNLHIARHGHSMIQLPNGIVHVYGGVQNPGVVRLTEVESLDLSVQPVVGSHVGNLVAPRALTQAALLQNGTTVHVGGVDIGGIALNTQMLYVDGQDISGLTGDMVTPRINHTLTTLPTGFVLVAGGADPQGGVTNTVEIFDPQTSVYLKFATEQLQVNTSETFTLVDAQGIDITAGTTLTAVQGGVDVSSKFVGATFTPTALGAVVITATNPAGTAKVTITVIQ
jgi:hypothetical protein